MRIRTAAAAAAAARAPFRYLVTCAAPSIASRSAGRRGQQYLFARGRNSTSYIAARRHHHHHHHQRLQQHGARPGFRMVASTGPPLLAAESRKDEADLPTLHLDSAPETVGWGSWIGLAMMSPTGQRWTALALRFLLAVCRPFIALWRRKQRHRPLPPLAEPLLERSALDLARLIRTRQVRSEEVVRAFAARARAVDPLLNAVVEQRFDAALQEARAADALVAALAHDPQRLARDKPLLGVPLTVKESLAVRGLAHTAGLRSLRRAGRRASADAEAVRRVRAAGAIPLLVSNCPELCMFFESFNASVGTTRNPHDTRRTAGGSSGGEAALLAAGASVIGIGSDIGGSLRLPAMFTGVFGHKPTAGTVSDIGHLPRTDDTDWWRFFSVGPMAHYAQDLPLMLKLMVKDEVVPFLKLDENVDVSQLRIFYIEEVKTYSTLPINSDVTSGLHRAVYHLKTKCKIEPQEIHIKELKHLFSIMLACLFSLEGLESVFQKNDNPNEWKSPSLEWLKKFVGMSDFCAYSLLYAPLKFLFGNLPKNKRSDIIKLIDKIRTQLEDILKDNGVLLVPTFFKPAVLHGEMYSYFMNGISCFLFNCTQMPATNCPVGRSKEGLPIGIQIGASRFQDRLSIAVAQELENALGGWIKP